MNDMRLVLGALWDLPTSIVHSIDTCTLWNCLYCCRLFQLRPGDLAAALELCCSYTATLGLQQLRHRDIPPITRPTPCILVSWGRVV